MNSKIEKFGERRSLVNQCEQEPEKLLTSDCNPAPLPPKLCLSSEESVSRDEIRVFL